MAAQTEPPPIGWDEKGDEQSETVVTKLEGSGLAHSVRRDCDNYCLGFINSHFYLCNGACQIREMIDTASPVKRRRKKEVKYMDKNKEMRVCPKCSNKNRADANFCTRCGTQLVENPVIVDYKSLEKCNPSDFEPIPRVQKKLKPMVENKELIKQYTEHMRQVLHHQQEAYFCMIKILTILGMDNDF